MTRPSRALCTSLTCCPRKSGSFVGFHEWTIERLNRKRRFDDRWRPTKTWIILLSAVVKGVQLGPVQSINCSRTQRKWQICVHFQSINRARYIPIQRRTNKLTCWPSTAVSAAAAVVVEWSRAGLQLKCDCQLAAVWPLACMLLRSIFFLFCPRDRRRWWWCGHGWCVLFWIHSSSFFFEPIYYSVHHGLVQRCSSVWVCSLVRVLSPAYSKHTSFLHIQGFQSVHSKPLRILQCKWLLS